MRNIADVWERSRSSKESLSNSLVHWQNINYVILWEHNWTEKYCGKGSPLVPCCIEKLPVPKEKLVPVYYGSIKLYVFWCEHLSRINRSIFLGYFHGPNKVFISSLDTITTQGHEVTKIMELIIELKYTLLPYVICLIMNSFVYIPLYNRLGGRVG